MLPTMHTTLPRTLFALFAAVSLLATGCVSVVTVTADQPGALIRYRGKGRPSYRWHTAGLVKNPGDTVSFETHYSTVSVRALWDEGTPNERRSEIVDIPLSNWHDPDSVTLHRQ